MSAPTISVIMATYNHANYVAQAIDSVLAQQGVDFEFLIADDGSVDSTKEVIASIKDERIRFFPHQVNRGACTVTNELIQHSTGEFVALLNSDDYWKSNDKLAYQLQILRDNPLLAASFGRAHFIDRDGGTIEKSSFPYSTVFDQENRSTGAWLRRFFYLGNCICHPTMLIRRSCYEEVGLYNNRLRQLPDLDMWVRLFKRYPIHVSEREMVHFRILAGENASSQHGANFVRTLNEHMLIANTFFDNVTASQLLDGFGDVLRNREIRSDEHLEIEKTLLFFSENESLYNPYRALGILKLRQLLDIPSYHKILTKEYGVDDIWFQNETGKFDGFRPKVYDTLRETQIKLEEAEQKLHQMEQFRHKLRWIPFLRY